MPGIKSATGIILSLTALLIITYSVVALIKPDERIVGELIEEADALPPPPGVVHTDLVYRSSPTAKKRLDLYEPLTEYTPGRAPLVVFYHGGSWIYGDKVTIRIIDRFLARMRSEGYFVAAVNYTTSILRGFGGPVDNGIAAVRWLREQSSRYGYDPDDIALYGVSAGGHVALMTEIEYREEGCISMVLAECAPSDLVAMAQGEAFDASSSLALLPDSYLRRFSPVYSVAADMAPVLIYHGDADEMVDVAQSIRLARAVNGAGGHAELEIYRDGTHAFLGMSDSLWYRQETRALKFMRTYLK